jgi:hypothetical protein
MRTPSPLTPLAAVARLPEKWVRDCFVDAHGKFADEAVVESSFDGAFWDATRHIQRFHHGETRFAAWPKVCPPEQEMWVFVGPEGDLLARIRKSLV